MRTRALLLTIGAGVGGWVLGWRFRRYAVVERSMEPTLEAGDFVISDRRFHQLRRHDIVVYEARDGSRMRMVKRVVGLAGEAVTLDFGIISIDGRTIEESWATGAGSVDGEWHVDEGQVFVLGDKRSRSIGDSATVGPIPIEAIDSVVRWRYWPLDRRGSV